MRPPALGVILAGGLSRRMGGADKPLLTLGGLTLLEHVAQRLAPQCHGLILNANGDPSRFERTSIPIVPDSLSGRPGPLAGILAGLEWAATHCRGIEWIVSVPADTPFIPEDLVLRLQDARREAGLPLACAVSGAQVHHAIGLWPIRLQQDLRRAIAKEGMRRLGGWAALHGYAEAAWSAEPVDPFFNINTPEELAQAKALLRQEKVQ
ncbi:molybdenum cofactor guanylyltransferase MobA [Microvirga aerilata]|uniref:Molybdenum cofactor guanylyltransferase n=1 Tax=Microvirga aerilata TaxID=670292 RepID=A0A937CWU7_9HYPH|nr:molybdenum cofactor guanylyltransferase MobA [Microvirga aerilata]MBL0404293.1 molybdenum cofactor guanylyltransferase MobA [Microvirga aerilata]